MVNSSFDRRTFLSLTAGAAAISLARPGWASAKSSPTYDVVIYGGSSAGVIAAIQARRMGKTAVIVNPYGFLGGMTASGLSAANVLNPVAISGLTREFFVAMGKVYGTDSYTRKFFADLGKAHGTDFSRLFEPHVAEKAFNDLVAEAGVPVFHHERLDLKRGVSLNGRRIGSLRTESGRQFSGKMFIDATYEGDLMAKAGVTYIVGRESNAQYGETLNGFQRAEPGAVERVTDFGPFNLVIKDVDPYVVRGDPASGLLPRINDKLLNNGTADHRVQAYGYRVILTDDPANQIPFRKPEGYRELDYELLLRNFEAGDDRLPGTLMLSVPNRKVDLNNFGPFSTDRVGASFEYAEADHETRRRIDREHERYTHGFFWTLVHHPRVPASIRTQMQRWGYPKDEFQRNGGFPCMLFVRDTRRMVSDTVMTEQHCQHQKTVPDPVTLASFPMDSHVAQYIVNERGFVESEGWFIKRCKGPYGVSYRSIVPRQGECPNLWVPVCLSASHVAHGSIRMESEFMSLGQAAATAASIAIDQGVAAQQVPYAALRERLRADQMMLEWKV